MPSTLSRREVLRLRLAAQGLAGAPADAPADAASVHDAPAQAAAAVRRMLAVQGQDLPGTLWAIARRTPGATADDVRAAFTRGLLVRSWPMRGTLHAIAPADLRGIVPLTRDRILRGSTTRRAELGLSDRDVDAARDVVVEALRDGASASRAELLATLEAAGQPTSGQRGYHVLAHLGIEGTIALGPFAGAEQLFVLLDDGAPARAHGDDDAVLRDLVRRYVTARGPVTLADLAWWTKLPTRPLRAALAEVADGGTLDEVEVAGTPAWVGAGSLDRLGEPVGRAGAVLLLPGFDELVLGYADRSATLDAADAERIVPGGNGVFRSTVVQRGRVVGVWSRTRRARGMEIDVEPLVPAVPDALVRGITADARRYASFLGTPLLEVRVGALAG